MNKSLIYSSLLLTQITLLYAEGGIEIGCNILSNQEESCEEEDIFMQGNTFKLDSLDTIKLSTIKKTPLLEHERVKIELNKKKSIINITKNLSSITVIHQKKSLKIVRKVTKKNQSCPPNCIQPIHIKNIKTVGILETLKFMDSTKKNRRMILVDSRTFSSYKKNTIPTATNIPNSILEKRSKHINIILRLLGAKKIKKKWLFKHVHTLLIFDNGYLDYQANKLISRFIELGYPQNKILYYHGGMKSWTDAGLTTV
jgi:rhodanese-related sulfurtransferase